MYLLGAITQINWTLSKTESTVLLTDLDLSITDPLGIITYIDSAIDISNFLAPTITDAGSASYDITPEIEGLYTVRLVKGNSADYTVFSKIQMFVFDNSTTINGLLEKINFSSGAGVPDGGTSGQILVKNSSNDGDASWVDNTSAGSTSVSGYCPGYPYSYAASDTTFTIPLATDLTALFYVGRRLQFIDGANIYYGVIADSSYQAVAPFEATFLTMVMENSAILTATITDVCFVSSIANWSTIAEDPFTGTSINAIISGRIGAVTYWVAVGNAGKVFYSVNDGLNWAQLVTATTENLNDVAYDINNESFCVVGNNNTMFLTYDFINVVVASSTGVPVNLPITNIIHIPTRNNWYYTYLVSGGTSSQARRVTSDLLSASLNVLGLAAITTPLAHHKQTGDYDIYAGIATVIGFLSSDSDTGATSYSTYSNTIVEGITPYGLNNYEVLIARRGASFGVVSSLKNNQTTDSVTTPEPLNGLALSSVNNRTIFVGDNGYMCALELAEYSNTATPVIKAIANGFAPLANITAIHSDELNGLFIAVANNGQICRSTNGLS